MFNKTDRVAIFIDGSSLQTAAKLIGIDRIDYTALREYFITRSKVLRFHYYTTIPPAKSQSQKQSLIDWLQYNRYKVTAPIEKSSGEEDSKRKTSVAVQLAVDAIELFPRLDHIVLFTGNTDFVPLVQAAQRQGIRVSVASTLRGSSPIMSDALRRQADEFIELADLLEEKGYDNS